MWTHTELQSEACPAHGEAWRVVEAQHEASTRKITDSSAEQTVLKNLLDNSKPPYPKAAEPLHYLLKSPFRYDAPYPHGSRFRRAHSRAGVFYCADHPQTALAEMAFYRLLFFSASPQTPFPSSSTPVTLFSIGYRTDKAINLTHSPLLRDQRLWEDREDYQATQRLAEKCRQAHIEIIRYRSVRDPSGQQNLALLTPTVFTSTTPECQQTWFLMVRKNEVEIYRTHSENAPVTFAKHQFSKDKRLR